MEKLSIEFYNTPEGDVMVKPLGRPAFQLDEKQRDIIEYILAILRDRYPHAHKALMQLYSKSTMNKVYFEYRVVHRFIRCNFGEYDQYNHDINSVGQFKFEEVRCPLRGECPYENVICRPKMDRQLSEREMDVYRLIVENLPAEEIALRLCISPNTVNRHRENMKAKLDCHSVGELISYWYENGMK